MLVVASCSSEEDATNRQDTSELDGPKIIETVRHESDKLTAYNFEYPSTDPFGKPVRLTGTIVVGDEVTASKPARGLMLYNHFTVYRADQCPSRGYLDSEKLVAGSGLITISADYYGFGITESEQQAYCIARANAQASVDALLAAKKLIPTLGLEWDDDVLFNIGYSQGGQTAIGVVRLLDEQYPKLRITCTIAGGGSYDIPETYRQMIASNVSGMPSTVVSVLLAYNEYFSLDISRDQMFKEPLLSHIDEWILSKRYTREQIDSKIGSQTISDWATPEIIDQTSSLSQRLMSALEQDNLCKGWKPRSDEHIVIVHHSKDITVPVANANNLYHFLKEDRGLKNVSLISDDWGSIGGKPAHETGAYYFSLTALTEVCTTLKIWPWINLSLLWGLSD